MARAGSSRWLSMRVLGGTLGADWERERRDTLFLMGAILLAVLPHLAYLPAWTGAGFGLLFAWRLGLIFTGRGLPGGPVRLAAAGACTAGVLAEFDTVLGREAGVALLVLFLGLKLMEMRARRDVFVVIFLCFFLLLTGFFHSQSPFMAITAAAGVVALLGSMVTMQFGQREAPIARRFRMVMVLVGQAVPIAAVLFVLFPRISGPLWGLPDDANSGRTGMSDTMSPGQISNLAQDGSVAFRVEFTGPAPEPAQMYWRGPVLGHFDGRTWRPVRRELGEAPTATVEMPRTGRSIRYRSTLEPQPGRWLFPLEATVELPRAEGMPVTMSAELEALAAEPVPGRLRYESAARLDARTGLNETRLSRQEWLQLPPGEARRTLEMAARWRDEETDPERLVQRALAMFRDNGFRYTLQPPLLEGDPIDRFLFETRAGFCEHYSSAFVILMRALDIPARVVTGYQGAEANEAERYWIVRQSDAHAWTEVWLEGRGWVRIDPTASVAPDRIQRGAAGFARSAAADAAGGGRAPEWLLRMRMSLDGLTHGWNQWVLNYDRTRQQSLLASFGLDATDPRA
ncbi:MAG: DUF3488 and transglutaminase-like domain-containing protein, partial [Burkholderiales bacterium]